MRYIEPILLVSGDNEYETLQLAKSTWRDFDILIPYEFQRMHYKLINNYIAPEYYQMCPIGEDLAHTIRLINKHPYQKYFKFFFVKFRQSGMENFEDWLKSEHPLYIKDKKLNLLRYYQLRRFYNTLIIDLKLSNGNIWNRFWKLPPSFFNDESLKNILKFLTDGGKLIFRNIEGNMGRIFDLTREGYTQISDDCFIKNETPKTKYKEPRKWL